MCQVLFQCFYKNLILIFIFRFLLEILRVVSLILLLYHFNRFFYLIGCQFYRFVISFFGNLIVFINLTQNYWISLLYLYTYPCLVTKWSGFNIDLFWNLIIVLVILVLILEVRLEYFCINFSKNFFDLIEFIVVFHLFRIIYFNLYYF